MKKTLLIVGLLFIAGCQTTDKADQKPFQYHGHGHQPAIK